MGIIRGISGVNTAIDTIKDAVDLNTAKVSNVDHPLVETAVPSGAVFTDTVYDDSTTLKDADIGTTVLAPNGDASQLTGLPESDTKLLFEKSLFGGM